MERFSGILRTNREAFVMKIKTRIQYFKDNSNIQSLGYVISLTQASRFKRLFWLSTLSACAVGSYTILLGALRLYVLDAVSYSVETDYLNWNTPFPAVTVCENPNATKIREFAEKKYKKGSLTNFIRDISFWTSQYCKPCVNCKMDVSCIEDFMPVVRQVRSVCAEIMTECSFNGEDFRCCERFKPIDTEYGECYVFNSRISEKKIEHFNRITGLPTLTFTAITDAVINIHSPAERVSVGTENLLSHCRDVAGGMRLEVNLKAEETVNDASVTSIAAKSRDCLFENEVPTGMATRWPFKEYTHGACVWVCKALVQIESCNCTSHFMPKIENIPVCNLQGQKCLYINKKSLEAAKSCDCPMSCAEVIYSPVHVRCPRSENVSEMKGFITMGQFPYLRLRRHAIRDMLGLVVDFGGVVGVFFGASLLSFLEIIYIFCIRKY